MNTIRNAFTSFFKEESASSIILILSAVLAVIFANSALSESYFNLLNLKIGISAGEFKLSKPVILWINDGLMAIFFFVIGLEIKRELLAGELRSWKKSTLPIMAALGGMIVPVLLFFLFHTSNEGMRGWGIPMATDIAFSLGILTLLGKRVPLSLKIFLTAFAIIDDLGAVMVIAIFYSAKIYWMYTFIALGIYSILILLTFTRVNARGVYFVASVVIWYLFLKSGIHPTIAGVMMAFAIPVNRRVGKRTFTKGLKEIVDSFEESDKTGMFLNQKQLDAIDRTSCLVDNVQPYLQKLERQLHGFVAFFIMPVFALANAGVSFSTAEEASINSIAWHIALALFFGKVIGITLFSYLGIKLKIARLPDELNMNHIFGASFLGAIGFTMALFINSLAFTEPGLVNSAKFGIIGSSVIAGFAGYFILKKALKGNA